MSFPLRFGKIKSRKHRRFPKIHGKGAVSYEKQNYGRYGKREGLHEIRMTLYGHPLSALPADGI